MFIHPPSSQHPPTKAIIPAWCTLLRTETTDPKVIKALSWMRLLCVKGWQQIQSTALITFARNPYDFSWCFGYSQACCEFLCKSGMLWYDAWQANSFSSVRLCISFHSQSFVRSWTVCCMGWRPSTCECRLQCSTNRTWYSKVMLWTLWSMFYTCLFGIHHGHSSSTRRYQHYFTLFLHLWISRPSSANSTCTTTGPSHGLGKPIESSSKNSTDKCRTWEFGSLQCQESGVAWRFWDATCLGKPFYLRLWLPTDLLLQRVPAESDTAIRGFEKITDSLWYHGMAWLKKPNKKCNNKIPRSQSPATNMLQKNTFLSISLGLAKTSDSPLRGWWVVHEWMH